VPPMLLLVTVVTLPSYSRTRTARLLTVVLWRKSPRVGVLLMLLLALLTDTFTFWLNTMVVFVMAAKCTKKSNVSRASSHRPSTPARSSAMPETLFAFERLTRRPAAVMSVVAVGEPDCTKTL